MKTETKIAEEKRKHKEIIKMIEIIHSYLFWGFLGTMVMLLLILIKI